MEQIRVDSRSALLRAGVEVLGGNPGAALAEIASRAGVGRATLHRHFPSRDALVRALALAALDAVDAALRGLETAATARAALVGTFAALVPLGPQYGFLARCPVDDPEIDRRYAVQLADLGELVTALRAEGLVADDVPDAWAVGVLDGLIWSAWSSVADGSCTEADAVRLATRTALRGLGREG